MKWSIDEFVAYLKTPPSSECEAFKRQNTIYAIFIILEALIGNDGSMKDGVLTLDDVQYDCTSHIPMTAIQTYGFAGELEDSIDETVTRAIIGLLEGVYLLKADTTVESLENTFGEICDETPEWNYYGAFMENDSVMPAEWLVRATALFAPAPAPAPAPTPVPEPENASIPEPSVTQPAVFFGKARTRRTHGRRALSPVRSPRATATTRRSKHHTH